MSEPDPEFGNLRPRRALERDLQQTKRELATAYDELQSTVKALEMANEELRTTNEELEATNEALGSTNEVLETMSRTLQSANEELDSMKDALRDRTDETVQANSFLGSVLSGIEQGVIVVDRTLRVIAWSRRAADLWGLCEEEVEGEHLLNLDIGIPVQRLRDPIRQILAGSTVDDLELEGRDRRGKPIEVQIAFVLLQNRPDAEKPDGAILLVSQRSR
jgi:two-component system CheB/CheR fusion protein